MPNTTDLHSKVINVKLYATYLQFCLEVENAENYFKALAFEWLGINSNQVSYKIQAGGTIKFYASDTTQLVDLYKYCFANMDESMYSPYSRTLFSNL